MKKGIIIFLALIISICITAFGGTIITQPQDTEAENIEKI
jgi:hypothetical protein